MERYISNFSLHIVIKYRIRKKIRKILKIRLFFGCPMDKDTPKYITINLFSSLFLSLNTVNYP